MLKVMVFLSRRPDLSAEAFEQHLHTTHAPLVAQLSGLRRLWWPNCRAYGALWSTARSPIPAARRPRRMPSPRTDSTALAAMQAALTSPQGQAVNADARIARTTSALRMNAAVPGAAS